MTRSVTPRVRTLRRRYPGADVVDLHYRVDARRDRPGQGPPFVFVHGFGCGLEDWRAQVDSLEPDFPVFRCDLPGHGDSTHRLRHCRVEELGHHVAALLEHEGLRDACLGGHSLGCRVVLQAAADAPYRVGGVVLVDGSWIGHGDAAALEKEAREAFENTGFEPMVRRLFAEMFLPGTDPALVEATIERALALDPEVGTTLFGSLVAWDCGRMEPVLEALECPVLAIQSTYLNTARERVAVAPGGSTPWLDLLRSKRPDARIELLPGVGHFAMREGAEAVNGWLRVFARGG